MSPIKRNLAAKRERVRVQLGPARLYLDEISDILQELTALHGRRVSPDDRYPERHAPRIRLGGGASADMVDDLRDATSEELARLTISGGGVNVDLWDIGADVSTDGDDRDADLTARGIAEFVASRKWRPALWHSLPKTVRLAVVTIIVFGVGANTLVLASPLFLDDGPTVLDDLKGFGGVVLIISTVTLAAVIRKLGSLGCVHVVPVRRTEATGLSRETKRGFAIAIPAALVGALITAVAGLWSGVFQ